MTVILPIKINPTTKICIQNRFVHTAVSLCAVQHTANCVQKQYVRLPVGPDFVVCQTRLSWCQVGESGSKKKKKAQLAPHSNHLEPKKWHVIYLNYHDRGEQMKKIDWKQLQAIAFDRLLRAHTRVLEFFFFQDFGVCSWYCWYLEVLNRTRVIFAFGCYFCAQILNS